MNKKYTKKILFKTLLMVELFAFGFTYLFGKNGICYLYNVQNENNDLKKEILILKNEVDQLSEQINEWDTDTFYKEKIAREKLQMSKKNDEIYYLI